MRTKYMYVRNVSIVWCPHSIAHDTDLQRNFFDFVVDVATIPRSKIMRDIVAECSRFASRIVLMLMQLCTSPCLGDREGTIQHWHGITSIVHQRGTTFRTKPKISSQHQRGKGFSLQRYKLSLLFHVEFCVHVQFFSIEFDAQNVVDGGENVDEFDGMWISLSLEG